MMPGSIRTRMLEAFRLRMYFFLGIVSFVFIVLVLQLINLQLIHGREFAQKSRMNMENNIPIAAARGEMYDRNFQPGKENKVIVSNRPSFNVTTIPANFPSQEEMEKTVMLLGRVLRVDPAALLAEVKGKNPWERITLKEDVGFDSIVKIATHREKFPHIDWEDANVRVYNHGNMFAHLVGYIGVISREEHDKLKGEGYRHYQRVGKSGIEKQYDRLLRGTDGYIRRIVDVHNRTEGEEVGLDPVAGNNLVLTVDYEVQKAAYDAMENIMGAAIVIKPSTGEVIAMVSKPDFNPNDIIARSNYEIIQQLMNDPNRPFLNRVMQSRFPPASTFKLLTAIAGLEEERWNPGNSIYCTGKFTLRGFVDTDFFDYDTHGNVNLYWAIARSCCVYFYQMGLRTGPTVLFRYAGYFGFDELTGIDIPGEIAGFIPSKRWKLRVFGQSWYDGDTVNLSIGQGFITVTPLGLSNLVCGIVNNGIIHRPQVIREVRTPDNRTVVRSLVPARQREIPISPQTLSIVREGMRMAVTSGTCRRLNHLSVPIAGKTGTAQTRSRRDANASQHGWFVGYAPYDGPPEKAIAVVVFAEFSGGGAVGAVPVAEKIFARLISQGYFQ